MPRDSKHTRTQVFFCSLDGCNSIFSRKSDQERHVRSHLPPSQRPFKCDIPGCDFTANQKNGLKCHQNSVHLGIRLPCRKPYCGRDFSDPSTLSRHTASHHKLSASRKQKSSPWGNLTNTFAINSHTRRPRSKAPATVASTSYGRKPESLGKVSANDFKGGRHSPDLSNVNVTLHTSPVGRQEAFSCQSLLLDSSLLSFTPSPTSPPLSRAATPYQPDWSSSTSMLPGLPFPDQSLGAAMTPGFQIGFGIPSSEQPADRFFPTPLQMPVDDHLLAQTFNNTTFFGAPNVNVPDPSRMVPPMTNYDATYSAPGLFCEPSQGWEFDNLSLNFGYGAPRAMEYYSRSNHFNGMNTF